MTDAGSPYLRRPLRELEDAIRAEIEALVDERGKVLAGPNTRALLEEATERGIARRTGAMGSRPASRENVETPFGRMRVEGSLWDQYELIR